MKTLVPLCAMATGLFLAALPSHAQTIVSVSTYVYTALNGPGTYTPNANFTAGVADAGNGGDYYVNNWNETVKTGSDRNGTDSPLTGSNLIDSTGATTGISYSLPYLSADNTGSTSANFPYPDGSNPYPFYTTSGNANSVLASQGVSQANAAPGTPLVLTLNGLNASATYTLVAYVSNLFFGGATTASWTVGSQTYYTDPTSGTGLTGWVQGNATTAGAAVASNYVEFDGLTGSSTLTLTGEAVGGGSPALMGFQLIETGSATTVPEPSTVWLGVLGFLGLAAHLRRRRLAQI